MREICEEKEPELTRGYIKALMGFITALEENDHRTAVYRILNGKLTKKEVKDLYRRSKKIYTDEFRRDEERDYEKAWVDLLEYYMKNEKIEEGLDKFMEEE